MLRGDLKLATSNRIDNSSITLPACETWRTGSILLCANGDVICFFDRCPGLLAAGTPFKILPAFPSALMARHSRKTNASQWHKSVEKHAFGFVRPELQFFLRLASEIR